MLSRHVNAEKVIAHSREQSKKHGRTSHHDLLVRENGQEYGTTPLPKYHIPSKGIPGDDAYELIHNELSLDGNPLLNLASSVPAPAFGPTPPGAPEPSPTPRTKLT